MKKTSQIIVVCASILICSSIASAADPLDMTIGATGRRPGVLQMLLIEKGFHIPAVESKAVLPGYFGVQTQQALAQYQQTVGLPAYGYFGALTRAALQATGDLPASLATVGNFTSTDYITLPSANTSTSNTGTTGSTDTTLTSTDSTDTTPPSAPLYLRATDVTQNGVTLSWIGSIDQIVDGQPTSGVAGYNIYANGSQIDSSVGTTYTATGLSPSTPYVFTVAAYDAAGNVSDQSESVSVTTSVAAADTSTSNTSTDTTSTDTTNTTYIDSTPTDTTSTTDTSTSTATTVATTTTTTTTTTTSMTCTSASPVAPIFVVMGQSNAWGLGKISVATSTVTYLDGQNWPFDYWAMAQGGWSNGSLIKTAQSGYFGPELGISYNLVANNKIGFYIFKYAVGGTSLALQWGSRGTGGLYDKAVTQLKAAESQICSTGYTPVVRAVFWMQGESDAVSPTTANEYQQNLERLVSQSRQDFLGTNSPFIIGLIDSVTGLWQYAPVVRTAEKAVAAEPFNGSVETNDLPVYPAKCSGSSGSQCQAHYTTQGQLTLGTRFYNEYVSMGGQ